MRADQLMTTSVVTTTPETSVKEVVRLLATHSFTTLPVVNEDGDLVGVVTEADLLRGRILPDPRTLIHQDAPPPPPSRPSATVAEVMTTEVVTAAPDAHEAVLGRLMLDKHLRVIPIVVGTKLAGVVSRRDLLRTIAREGSVIERDVRHHLAMASRRPWQVAVADGCVTLTCEGADASERHMATVIAGALPGVVGVQVAAPAPQ
ncbi:CBS domain-containing protein [Amycolatopsis sp. MtRt-6]|uniref:CBS domain-containing protein n=1 Tax=Amycolatopsis sp. MtRt-6 TaxID=2792782 RepID=UPI001A8F97E9|nr:CBS domain-containing protein [Amycolatopsis sp. MtRt-6]